MSNFLSCESGAVTVDWVVMTAALVGLGLAVSTTVSTGVEQQANATSEVMGSHRIMTTFSRVFGSNDFENGRGSWTAGEVIDVPGFGNLLAFSGSSPSGSMEIDVGSEYSHAEIEFDMIIADSWDNEQGTISLGGEDVVIASHAWRDDAPVVQTFEGPGDTSVTLTRASTGTGVGGGRWQNRNDYTYRVSIVTENDGGDLTLGATTNLNSGTNDEFFGVDNVVVRGTSGQ